MPRVTEAIQNFLRAREATHNGPDLVKRWNPFMETQVNVAAGYGERVDGKQNTYTDGIYEWFNIRIPKNAATSPEFKDYMLKWPLDLHVEGIGWTGWDWSARKSRALGFDFDSIVGHAKGVGVTAEELDRVRNEAMALDYVEVRKSTGGSGLHLYVYFDDAGVPTANHTEHAALGRAILGRMSSETGFDFASQIDACGGNMWIWHRKMSAENEGLKRIKEASRYLSVADLPNNWRDHIEVITRRRAKVRVSTELKDENLDPFEALASARKIVPLDPRHKAIIDELTRSGYSTVWVPDHHLLQTHTKAFETLMSDADKVKDLDLKGFFRTSAAGNDPGTPNSFAFPLEHGGWRVYRFSPGISEAETWNQDKEGWTNCFFNRHPDLGVAAKSFGGLEDPEHGGYIFQSATKALEAVEALGQKVKLPSKMHDRETRLKAHRDGRLVIHVLKREGDEGMDGWIPKRDKWVKVFNIATEAKKDELGYTEYDTVLRQLVTPAGEDAGWYLRANNNEWNRYSTEKMKLTLLTLGNSDAEVKLILGTAIRKSWKLVNLPFQAEYPGDRQWNMDAAQYRFQPAELEDDEAPKHLHWDRILRHCGQDLDGPVRNHEWCRTHNIKSGADFLLYWLACLLRNPFYPLPYLFLYGNQNSGKSILHEAASLLMTKGVASADRALTNTNDFNGELANCVLAYIEEKDISAAGASAYNKIKDWVTSPELWIRRMRTDAYKQINTLHFIHCANHLQAIPISPGDTRICVIFVPDLQPGEEIPKGVLLSKLEQEAPAFMRTIMDLTLPPLHSRMYLPAIKTKNKERAEMLNRDALEAFVADSCFQVPGELVDFKDFYKAFEDSLPTDKKTEWTKNSVIQQVKQKFPYLAYARYTDNRRVIGNLSLTAKKAAPDAKPWIVVDNWLTPKKD